MKNKIQLLKTGLLSAFVITGISTFAQFSGSYAPSNWTFNAVTAPSDGYVDVSGAPGSIILAGDDDGSGGCCDEHVSYSVTIPTSGSISFDYNHSNPDIDEAYYAINGTRTIISYGSGSGSVGPIAVTAGDVFSFLVVSYDDCCGRGVLTISNFTGPALLISVDAAVNPTSCQPNSGSIAVTVSGGATPYSYNWNLGAYTIEDLSGLPAGTYSLTVTDANGSSATSSTTLTEVVPPAITVDATTNVDCNGNSTGAINVTVAGGTAPYSYSWNSGAYTTKDLANIPAGSYNLSVTDANGCSASVSATINEPSVLAATVNNTTDVDCNGNSTGTINVTTSGGTAPYSYDWNSGTYTTENLSNIPAGSYSLSIADANGCSASASATINEPSTLSATVDNTTNVNCNGNSTGAINVTVAGGTSPYSYSWNSGAYTTEDLSNIPAGSYNLSVTDANGCSAAALATISEPTALSASVDNTTNVDCNGNSTGAINVTVAGGTSPYSYNWNSGAYSTEDLSGLAAGTYSLSVTDANGCSASASATINEPPVLAASVDNTTNVDCNGNATGAINVTTSGGTTPYSYDWNSGAYSTEDLSSIPAGAYSLSVTDINGCSVSASATISEPSSLSAVVTMLTNVDCFGGNTGAISVSVTGGTAGYSYSWNLGAYTTKDLSNISAGLYNLSVTDANGCFASTSISVTEPSQLFTFINTTTNVDCNGNSTGAIDATAVGGTAPYSYDWNSGAYATEDLLNIPAGTYNLSVTDANGCSASTVATVNEPTALSASINSITDVDCYGNSTGMIDATVAGGTTPYSYNWNSGAYATQDLSGLAAGAYSLSVTDANGCSAAAAATVNEPAILAITIDSVTDVDCNGNSNGAINSSVSGGTAPYSYNWNAGTYITEDISGVPAGTYNFVVTDANGCSAAASATINEPPALSITIDNVTDVDCNGNNSGSINISVGGGTTPYIYSWNSGAYAIEDLSGIPAGSYGVSVTDANGCSTSASATVNEPAALSIVTDLVTNVDCNGNPTGAINVSVSGGTASYSYDWNNGTFASENISGLLAGSYTLVVTDANGCSTSDSENITEPDALSVTIDSTINVDCNGNNTGAVYASVFGGTTGYSYDWNTGTYSTEDISSLPAGTYNLIVTDTNGCSVNVSTIITEPTSLSVATNYRDVDCNGNNNGTIDLTVSGGTVGYIYNWNNGAYTTEDLSGLSPGTYDIIVTDTNGCSASTSVSITEPAVLTASVDALINPSACGSTDGSISVTTTGGTMSYSYDWNGGAYSTEDLSGVGSGFYQLTISDANGCTFVLTDSLVEPMTLIVSIDSITDIDCYGNSTGAVYLSSTGGAMPYTYSWNNGAYSTEDITGITAGTYNFVVTDANNCSTSANAIVAEPDTLSIIIDSTINVLCNGATSGAISVSVSGGTTSYSYDWNSGAFITEDLTGLSAGNYILTVTDAHNCTSVASVTLIEPSALSLSAISTDEINGNDGAIDLTVTGGTPSYSFSWDNGMTTEDLSGLTAGTYSVTVSDANGCTDSTSATVTSHVSVEEYGEIVLNVYPNPTSGIVYIEFSDILTGNIKVYNSIGQILSSRNITNIRHEINLGEYEQGVYFIEVSGNGFKKTISIVHQ